MPPGTPLRYSSVERIGVLLRGCAKASILDAAAAAPMKQETALSPLSRVCSNARLGSNTLLRPRPPSEPPHPTPCKTDPDQREPTSGEWSELPRDSAGYSYHDEPETADHRNYGLGSAPTSKRTGHGYSPGLPPNIVLSGAALGRPGAEPPQNLAP